MRTLTHTSTSFITNSLIYNTKDIQILCHTCKKRGRVASRCNARVPKVIKLCKFWQKQGDADDDCFKKLRKCSYCNKLGHVKDECFKVKGLNSENYKIRD